MCKLEIDMKILYVGHYNEGSTSKMRCDILRNIIPGGEFKIVNTDIPIYQTLRIFRSAGWRFKIGPLIWRVNNFLKESVNGDYKYDLVWIDKGVFIKPSFIQKLRKYSHKIVHFTPDPAFTYHKSRFFYRALKYYDYCVTTKSFEVDLYKRKGAKVIFVTQGYNPETHKPYKSFNEKSGVVFIGHYERNRGDIILELLKERIPVTIAGIGWGKFWRYYKKFDNLKYLGKGIFGTKYAETISEGLIGLGFLSKIIPELHTTRTFEIPACGTVLATEATDEITNIFRPQEVIYYKDKNDLSSKVAYLLQNRSILENICKDGFARVTSSNLDYQSILNHILISAEIKI